MALSIRDARVSDAAHVAALTGQLGYDVDAATVEARLTRLLPRGDQRFLMAELDGRPVGWVHVAVVEYVEAGASVIVAGLVVDRQHRRQGIGVALMKQAEEWAMSVGVPIVRLHSSATRTAAHRFYEMMGYTNIKAQYSFAKSLDEGGDGGLRRFVPRVER